LRQTEALLLLRVVQFLHRVVHVLVRFLDRIEFLLLLGSEERANLGGRALHHGTHLLHRFLVNRPDLRLRLLDDRADFRLLVRGQVQLFRDVLERISHHHVMAVSTRAGTWPLRIHDERSQRQCAADRSGNNYSFHVMGDRRGCLPVTENFLGTEL